MCSWLGRPVRSERVGVASEAFVGGSGASRTTCSGYPSPSRDAFVVQRVVDDVVASPAVAFAAFVASAVASPAVAFLAASHHQGLLLRAFD